MIPLDFGDDLRPSGLFLSATFGLAISAKLWERVRKYLNKNIKVQLLKNSAEPVGKMCNRLGDSPSAVHRGYKGANKGKQVVFRRDTKFIRRHQASR
ncbi:hypothetical protein H5410_056730 [Solanum commersonii]|uniref:Uncharacterized protein n=1 Tax=Solanum commersonii TaxID=4109 RepID=A0A9J5WN44_SOLCO|nr:hypothetical protein H5410_056730 [Solanum commersonii]